MGIVVGPYVRQFPVRTMYWCMCIQRRFRFQLPPRSTKASRPVTHRAPLRRGLGALHAWSRSYSTTRMSLQFNGNTVQCHHANEFVVQL
jgi:hypothetical protein